MNRDIIVNLLNKPSLLSNLTVNRFSYLLFFGITFINKRPDLVLNTETTAAVNASMLKINEGPELE